MKAEEFLKSKYYIPNSFAYGRDLEMVLDEYGGDIFNWYIRRICKTKM